MRNVANVLPAAGWLTVMGASAVMSSANAEEQNSQRSGRRGH
jgi:hypothetical protein